MYSNNSFDILSLIVAVGAIQGLFCMVIALFTDKGGRRTNFYFALLIGSISVSVGSFVLYRAGIFRSMPWIMKASDILQFIFGPALFLYVREVTVGKVRNRLVDLFHFLPAFAIFLFTLPFLLEDYGEQLNFIESTYSGPAGLASAIFEFLSTLHVWGYIVLSMLTLFSYRRRIRESFSSVEEINLGWLNNFLTGMIAVYTAFIGLHVLIFFGIDMLLFTIITTLIGSAAVYYLAFLFLRYINSLSHTVQVVREEEREEEPVPVKKQESKYSSSPLTEEDLDRHWQALVTLMESEQLYLQQELSLSGLAEKVGIPRQYLSQVINRKAGVNFYDFINSYRLEEFVRLVALPENSNYTILSIAFDAGFNSKASFNSFFKKSKGMTPSQYIKEGGS